MININKNPKREEFITKGHVANLYVDFEKVNETTWKYGIMRDLLDLGLKGRQPEVIKNFLSNRSVQVRVGSILSDSKRQEEGVPQVTLLSIKINNIANKLTHSRYKWIFYVNDIIVSYRSKNIQTIEKNLQQSMNITN